MSAFAAIGQHPALAGLARKPAEQDRLERFARDLAEWLHGAPADGLGSLTRVLTVLLRRPLNAARLLCEGRALLALETAARTAAALWPLLRGPDEPPPPRPPSEPAGAGGVGASTHEGEGEPEPGEAGGGEPGEGGTEDADPADVLAALGGLDGADADLRRLAAPLDEGDDPAGQLARALAEPAATAEAAARQADAGLRTLEQLLPGVGWSSAPGALEATLFTRLDDLARLLAKLPDLQKIADLLGRLEQQDQAAPRWEGGQEEVAGVTLSGDLARVLPAELALLADPETEDLFFARWTERRLISLELQGRGDLERGAPQAKGPVLLAVDTSGSMRGAPELAAKALTLAVCRRALPQGRRVHLLLFGGPGDRTELDLRPGRGDLQGLLDFLQLSFHAGTDFDEPLLRALELIREADLAAADVLVVTDGLGQASPAVAQAVAEARVGRGLRVWATLLGSADPAPLAAFADRIWRLASTGPAEEIVPGLLRLL